MTATTALFAERLGLERLTSAGGYSPPTDKSSLDQYILHVRSARSGAPSYVGIGSLIFLVHSSLCFAFGKPKGALGALAKFNVYGFDDSRAERMASRTA
jgi:hypothetical protein